MTPALRWAVGAIFIFYSLWKNKVTISTDESPTFQVRAELSEQDQTNDYLLTRLTSYYYAKPAHSVFMAFTDLKEMSLNFHRIDKDQKACQ